MSRTYRVTVVESDGELCASVIDLQGAHTFAPNMDVLDGYVREVIVLAEDLPAGAESSLNIEYVEVGEPSG